MSWLSKTIGKIPVVGGAINSVAHNVVDPLARSAVGALPGGSFVLSAGAKLGQMVPGGPSGSSDGGFDLGGFLKGAIPVVGAGLAGYEGIKNAQESNKMTQQALNMAGQDYASREPLRSAALARLTNPQRPDLNFATNTANPFAKKLPVVGHPGGL